MIQRLIGKLRGVHHGAISMQEMRRLVDRPDPVILEIGAHHGTETLRFLETFEHATVYAFEADPDVAKIWHANVKDPRAELIEMAISSQKGALTFHRSRSTDDTREGDASGSLKAPTEQMDRFPHIKFDQDITVPAISLDEWVAEAGLDRIDFIWADVQGAEDQLIAGGRQTLEAARHFYTEYGKYQLYQGHLSFDALVKLLPNHRVTKRWRHDVLLESTLARHAG